MSYECINCANPINAGARVCPYCHMNPYDPSATGPYTGLDSGNDLPMTLGILGAIVTPAVPVLGLAIIGAGIIAKMFKRSN